MSDILIDNKSIYKFELKIVEFFKIMNILLLTLFLIGIFTSKPEFILKVNFVFKIILALFLIYRFNSYRKKRIHFTELDRKICYSTGIYIILISFIDVITLNIEYIRNNYILPHTTPIIQQIKKSLENPNL